MSVAASVRASWSLRRRLVLGIVALLSLLSIVIGAVSVLTLRQTLIDRLDSQLFAAMKRSQTFLPPLGIALPERPPGIGDAQSAGTLGLIVRNGAIPAPRYLDDEANLRSLTPDQQRTLLAVTGTRPVTVQLGGTLGSYRVVTAEVSGGYELIAGLPLREVDATTGQLLAIIAAVAAIGIALAAAIGTFVVRVALRPLEGVVATATRVAELELDRGEVALAERVPQADSSTEVGQVGAALNRLLEHVAAALSARQASENRVRQFVADASHELRTPLASIRGYSELTRRSGYVLPEDIAKALSRIESESIRMTALVEELLLLARLDEGTELASESVELGALVVDAVSDARASSAEHRWVLDPSPVPVEVLGDPARIHQAISNLLANARLHTPPGATVTTTVERVGDYAIVTVMDDGPGIDPELLPTLFERFVRGDGSRSRAAGSTGLGLAIVKAIVEGHGGAITVSSVPGDTRFTVTLPLGSAP
jgi:Signal transduction histidine kinase